jgi:GT2 family glycosyltransferase
MTQTSSYCSIIVPTHQRPAALLRCLAAIARLDYPPARFEVIVVNDGGEGGTRGIVARFENDLAITFLSQPRRGPAAARNAAARRARGELLAFTDDDCEPDSGWLRALAVRFAAEGPHAFGGRTINALPDNLYAEASQALVDDLDACYCIRPCGGRFFPSNNLAVAADRFRAVGGFDAAFAFPAGEDRDFGERWQLRGFRLVHAPEAIVRHAHPLTFGSFWRQHMGYGRAARRLHLLRAERGRNRPAPECPRHYMTLLFKPFLRARNARGIALAMLRGVSQCAQAAGYLSASVRSRAPR